jgi:hypothetical protein
MHSAGIIEVLLRAKSISPNPMQADPPIHHNPPEEDVDEHYKKRRPRMQF